MALLLGGGAEDRDVPSCNGARKSLVQLCRSCCTQGRRKHRVWPGGLGKNRCVHSMKVNPPTLTPRLKIRAEPRPALLHHNRGPWEAARSRLGLLQASLYPQASPHPNYQDASVFYRDQIQFLEMAPNIPRVALRVFQAVSPTCSAQQ